MLQKGDIIHIEKGFSLMCDEIPEYYYKGRHPYSKKLGQGMITVGVPMIARSDIKVLREEISKMIRFTFAYNEVSLNSGIL